MREHMHSIEGGGEESLQYRFNEYSHFDTWGHYKHDFIDSLPPPKSIEQELEGTCSPHAPSYHTPGINSARLSYSSYMYALEYFELKNVFFLVMIPTLVDLRQQASRFKALAIAEVVGHALAEEALHEAQQRAESCEIAEAVLLGAAANRE